jgi:hypothetical protein
VQVDRIGHRPAAGDGGLESGQPTRQLRRDRVDHASHQLDIRPRHQDRKLG